MSIAFEQLRMATNPGVEDDGSGGMQVKIGFGMTRDADGVKLAPNNDTFKTPVRVKAQGNINLTGGSSPDAVDGVTLSVGDRILVPAQSTASQDGLYEMTVDGGGTDDNTWARTKDAPTGAEAAGWYVQVLEGSTDVDKLFRVDADQGGATVGTDGWTVVEVGGATSDTLAGDGLVANGAALDVNVDDSSIETNADVVRVKALGITNAMLAGSIANAKLSNSSVTVTAGDGLKTGGSVALGAAVTLDVDVSDFAGTGLEDDGSENLRLAAQGNGIAGGAGSTLSVDLDGATLAVGVSGVKVADGGVTETQLNTSVAGNGLTGGGGTVLAVGAGTGIVANANDVAVDVGSEVTFNSSADWTFPNGVTAKGLFVTGTMIDANHVANKAYVDAAASGLKWLAPAVVLDYQGTRTVAQIDALSPLAGWAVVAGDAGTPSAGSSDLLAAGDIAEYNGTDWKKIVSHSGGFVPSGTRCIVSAGALFAPLSDGTDENKLADFDGTSNTPTLTAPAEGNAALITGEASYYENLGYTYDNTAWVQFTGAGQINAGAGLTKSGQTFDVGAGNGITVLADTVGVDADSTTGGNIQPVNVVANGVGVDINAIAGTGLEADGSANLRLAAQGNGIAGGAGSTLSVNLDGTTLSVSASGVKVNKITDTEFNANVLSLDRLNIRFREETHAAGTFTNANPSTKDLAVAALIGTNEDNYNEVYRNGIADMANQGNGGSPSGATQYKIDNTGAGSIGRVTIGANIFASGHTYRVKYLSVT